MSALNTLTQPFPIPAMPTATILPAIVRTLRPARKWLLGKDRYTLRRTQRILTTLGNRDPVSVLQETPAKLAVLLKSQPADVLKQRPAPGKWSVGEILAHLADAEMVLGFRVRLILGQPGVPIQAFDQDVWASFSHYDQIPASESLERLTVNRGDNVRLLRSLTPEQLQHHGMHTERGRETVAYVLKMWAGHDLNHREQTERILEKSAAA